MQSQKISKPKGLVNKKAIVSRRVSILEKRLESLKNRQTIIKEKKQEPIDLSKNLLQKFSNNYVPMLEEIEEAESCRTVKLSKAG